MGDHEGHRLKPFLRHFEIAAGLAEKDRYRGAKWNDGDFYKWMEAVCAAQAVDPDPEWEKRLDLEGRNFFYTNPLRQEHNPALRLRWSRTRVPFITSFCCPPNVVRTVAEVSGYGYGRSADAIWINLYGSNVLSTKLGDGSEIRLEQTSNYPWEGNIEIVILECRDKPFSLNLRIPDWARDGKLTVVGEPSNVKLTPSSYAPIERNWKPGDIVRLQLEMPARLIESHPLVEETRNHVAIKRGPMVYCLESNDLPSGTRLANVRVPADLQLVARFDPELLQGVSVLEGTAVARSAGEWDGKLYREFKRESAVPVNARFIPYYAWSNRGASEMTVWLPLD